MADKNSLVVDACVLINLIASGIIEKILRSTDYKSYICTIVQNESIFLRDETDPREMVPIDITTYVNSGLLEICDLETDSERESFVDLAAKLDDGEAMSLAIALSRQWDLATDDKKARRTFSENVAKERELVSTPSLIRKWAETEKISEQELKRILFKIEKSARYIPAQSDADYQWWMDSII